MSIEEIFEIVDDKHRLVRAIFSGRRRNMQPRFEKVEIRPVDIKDSLMLQVITQIQDESTTTNIEFGSFATNETLMSGYANCLVEATDKTFTVRFTKKGSPQIHQDEKSNSQATSHNRQKTRLFDASSEFLKLVGISDNNGRIRPSMSDKYFQIEEFVRLMMPLINEEIATGRLQKPTSKIPLQIVDHGCGNAYLTFAVHEHLNRQGLPNSITGIDKREQSRQRNASIANNLGFSSSMEFRAERISESAAKGSDLTIALHACDTATDEAIAWAISNRSQMLMISPCCHHDLQTQMTEIPEPWSLVTKHGIFKERFGDILTDSLRAQILRLHGYRTEIIEFIGDGHTPRNLIIRACRTGASPDQSELTKYRQLLSLWSIKPKLAEFLNFE